MKTLLNLIWFVFSGLWLAIGYAIAGVIMYVLIITIPFGVASFRMAGYALWPFGRAVVTKPGGDNVGIALANVIWFLLAGLWIAIGHVITAVPLFLSIIGIPLGIGNLKMIPIACFPLGKTVVPSNAIPYGYTPVVQL